MSQLSIFDMVREEINISDEKTVEEQLIDLGFKYNGDDLIQTKEINRIKYSWKIRKFDNDYAVLISANIQREPKKPNKIDKFDLGRAMLGQEIESDETSTWFRVCRGESGIKTMLRDFNKILTGGQA